MPGLHLNKCMFGHSYKLVPHLRIGPIRNIWGYTISVAEIDEIWMIRYSTPYKKTFFRYFADHEQVLEAIKLLNQDRRY